MGRPACQISNTPTDQPPTIRPYQLLLVLSKGICQVAFREKACGTLLFDKPRSPEVTLNGFCAKKMDPEARKPKTSLMLSMVLLKVYEAPIVSWLRMLRTL